VDPGRSEAADPPASNFLGDQRFPVSVINKCAAIGTIRNCASIASLLASLPPPSSGGLHCATGGRLVRAASPIWSKRSRTRVPILPAGRKFVNCGANKNLRQPKGGGGLSFSSLSLFFHLFPRAVLGTFIKRSAHTQPHAGFSWFLRGSLDAVFYSFPFFLPSPSTRKNRYPTSLNKKRFL